LKIGFLVLSVINILMLFVWCVLDRDFEGGPVFSRHRGRAVKLIHRVKQSEIGALPVLDWWALFYSNYSM